MVTIVATTFLDLSKIQVHHQERRNWRFMVFTLITIHSLLALPFLDQDAFPHQEEVPIFQCIFHEQFSHHLLILIFFLHSFNALKLIWSLNFLCYFLDCKIQFWLHSSFLSPPIFLIIFEVSLQHYYHYLILSYQNVSRC